MRFGLPVLDPPDPKPVRFAEAPGCRRSTFEHAPSSAGAVAYRAFAGQLTALLETVGAGTGA